MKILSLFDLFPFFLFFSGQQLLSAAEHTSCQEISAFHKACLYGDSTALKKMFKKNKLHQSLIFSSTELGETSLHLLARGSNSSLASPAEYKKVFSFLVLNNGVPDLINNKDSKENTPLMVAIAGENASLAKIFLRNAASLGLAIINKEGKTAVDLAREKENGLKDILKAYTGVE